MYLRNISLRRVGDSAMRPISTEGFEEAQIRFRRCGADAAVKMADLSSTRSTSVRSWVTDAATLVVHSSSSESKSERRAPQSDDSDRRTGYGKSAWLVWKPSDCDLAQTTAPVLGSTLEFLYWKLGRPGVRLSKRPLHLSMRKTCSVNRHTSPRGCHMDLDHSNANLACS
jgi:hypothetical protein